VAFSLLQKIKAQVKFIIGIDAANLVSSLLDPNPDRRPSISEVLKHKYFQTKKINSRGDAEV